jgi:N-acetylglutamate synthase-like GNAT family acetyltransferase
MDPASSTDGVRVRPTADLDTARELAAAAGLEIDGDVAAPLALWEAYDRQRLLGVVSLDEKAGVPVVGWIAVAESARGRGLGRLLLTTVEQEASRRGLRTLWATARAPGFFLCMGYEPAEAGEARDQLLAGCRDCPQLGTTCRPRAMRKTLVVPGA